MGPLSGCSHSCSLRIMELESWGPCMSGSPREEGMEAWGSVKLARITQLATDRMEFHRQVPQTPNHFPHPMHTWHRRELLG